MNRVLGFLAAGVVLSTTVLISAQTTTTNKPAVPNPPTSAGSTAAQILKPASLNQRAAVGGLGVGSFVWPGGWTLTAFGCYRMDTRLFCDFDTTNPNNQTVNTSIWSGAGGVNVVADGGRITQRHNAFFVGTDGSQFQTAYVTQQPVRFIIEYDDVASSSNSVSLVLTSSRIQSVPITQVDPSQGGTIPARSVPATQTGTTAPAGTTTQTGTTAQTGTAAAANGTTSNAANAASKTKKKLSDILNSVTK